MKSLRIGIILPSDLREQIFFDLPVNNKFALNSVPLMSGQTYHLNMDGELKLNDKLLETFSFPIDLKPLNDYPQIQEQTGICIRDIRTGRNFHWEKSLEQTFPGRMEIERHKDGLVLINAVALEDYIMCVATSEMNEKCPDTFLQVQTIAARSFVLSHKEDKHYELYFDFCNDDCCQRYQGTTHITSETIRATRETEGKVLVSHNSICDARYSKCCGGFTEKCENIWQMDPLPYLDSIIDSTPAISKSLSPIRSEKNMRMWVTSEPHCFCSPNVVHNLEHYLGVVDENTKYFRWEIKYSKSELESVIKNKSGLDNLSYLEEIEPGDRGSSGRLINMIIHYRDQDQNQKKLILRSEYDIRNILSSSFLFSSAFIIQKNGDDYIFKGAGWGHGVGLCQIGALGMALKGYSVEEILQHYYKGTIVRNLNDFPKNENKI